MNEKIDFSSICAKELGDFKTTKPHVLPIYATSSFQFETIQQGIDIFSKKEKGHSYSRYSNPTVDAVEEKVARLEGFGLDIQPKALMVNSGMAAISTLFLGLLKAGDKILTQSNLYGGTTLFLTEVLETLGVEAIMIDLKDNNQARKILEKEKKIKLIYLESPTNPTLSILDLEEISNLAKEFDVLTAIDNTFCTPYLQQPFRFGIDFIVHSTTKFLNGHGNSISGMIIGKDADLMQQKIWHAMKLTGTNANAWDAWLLHNGMKTLALRMDKHSENALHIAQYLAQQEAVEHVNYPGLSSHPDHELAKQQMAQFGAMLSFELKGGMKAGLAFMNKIKFCTLAPTLGDVDTLLLHPASMSHGGIPREIRMQNGISDGLIRMSIGIEKAADIVADLEQAMR